MSQTAKPSRSTSMTKGKLSSPSREIHTVVAKAEHESFRTALDVKGKSLRSLWGPYVYSSEFFAAHTHQFRYQN
eukprot:1259149-Amphidinium_carterae.1